MLLTHFLLGVAIKGSPTLTARVVDALGYPGLIVACVGLLVAAAGCAWLVRAWLSAAPTAANDGALLQELSRAHGLSRKDRRLLRSLARHYGVEPAASMFVEPEKFAAASQDAAFAKRRDDLVRLSERLFAVSP